MKYKNHNWYICIAFTLVSLVNQALFYALLFGLPFSIGVITCLEISRLSTMPEVFRIRNKKTDKKKSKVAIIIYLLVVLWSLAGNSLGYFNRYDGKQRDRLKDIITLANKVKSNKKQYYNEQINIANDNLHENSGVLGRDPNNKTYLGFNRDWEKRKAEWNKAINELTDIECNTIKACDRLIIKHGTEVDAEKLSRLIQDIPRETINIAGIKININLLWLTVLIALSFLVEIIISWFGFLAYSAVEPDQQTKPKTKQKEVEAIQPNQQTKLIETKDRQPNKTSDMDIKEQLVLFNDVVTNQKESEKNRLNPLIIKWTEDFLSLTEYESSKTIRKAKDFTPGDRVPKDRRNNEFYPFRAFIKLAIENKGEVYYKKIKNIFLVDKTTKLDYNLGVPVFDNKS